MSNSFSRSQAAPKRHRSSATNGLTSSHNTENRTLALPRQRTLSAQPTNESNMAAMEKEMTAPMSPNYMNLSSNSKKDIPPDKCSANPISQAISKPKLIDHHQQLEPDIAQSQTMSTLDGEHKEDKVSSANVIIKTIIIHYFFYSCADARPARNQYQ